MGASSFFFVIFLLREIYRHVSLVGLSTNNTPFDKRKLCNLNFYFFFFPIATAKKNIVYTTHYAAFLTLSLSLEWGKKYVDKKLRSQNLIFLFILSSSRDSKKNINKRLLIIYLVFFFVFYSLLFNVIIKFKMFYTLFTVLPLSQECKKKF